MKIRLNNRSLLSATILVASLFVAIHAGAQFPPGNPEDFLNSGGTSINAPTDATGTFNLIYPPIHPPEWLDSFEEWDSAIFERNLLNAWDNIESSGDRSILPPTSETSGGRQSDENLAASVFGIGLEASEDIELSGDRSILPPTSETSGGRQSDENLAASLVFGATQGPGVGGVPLSDVDRMAANKIRSQGAGSTSIIQAADEGSIAAPQAERLPRGELFDRLQGKGWTYERITEWTIAHPPGPDRRYPVPQAGSDPPVMTGGSVAGVGDSSSDALAIVTDQSVTSSVYPEEPSTSSAESNSLIYEENLAASLMMGDGEDIEYVDRILANERQFASAYRATAEGRALADRMESAAQATDAALELARADMGNKALWGAWMNALRESNSAYEAYNNGLRAFVDAVPGNVADAAAAATLPASGIFAQTSDKGQERLPRGELFDRLQGKGWTYERITEWTIAHPPGQDGRYPVPDTTPKGQKRTDPPVMEEGSVTSLYSPLEGMSYEEQVKIAEKAGALPLSSKGVGPEGSTAIFSETGDSGAKVSSESSSQPQERKQRTDLDPVEEFLRVFFLSGKTYEQQVRLARTAFWGGLPPSYRLTETDRENLPSEEDLQDLVPR